MSGRRTQIPIALSILAAVAACGQLEVDEPEVSQASQAVTSLQHPAFIRKLASPATYSPLSMEPAESLCGPNNLQHVNNYDGTLGATVAAVWSHKHPVGAMEEPSLVDPLDAAKSKYCSGTLIGRGLFLTAGHCVGVGTVGDAVSFNYERTPGSATALNGEKKYTITAVVEDSLGGLDYAIVRLAGNPGDTFGWTRLASAAPAVGDLVTIIQHPAGQAKQVEVGPLAALAGSSLQYADLDTLPGSSGSGVLNASGYLVGVHTNGGCAPDGTGANSGTRMTSIAAVSPTVAGILGAAQPNTLIGDGFVGTSTGSAFVERGWRWHDSLCGGGQSCVAADVNGDGRADMVIFTRGVAKDVLVALSTATGFATPVKWHDSFCASGETCRVADVNGDKRADLISFTRGAAADAWVALSTGGGFGAAVKWHDDFCHGADVCELADLNGDGRADAVAFTRGATGDVFVSLSTGGTFQAGSVKWLTGFCLGTQLCKLGDVDADKRADAIAFTRGATGDVFVARSLGTKFAPAVKWHDNFCFGNEVCDVGDVNADGRADVLAFTRGDTADVFVARSTGAAFIGTGVKWHKLFGVGSQTCLVGDVDGDKRADVISLVQPLLLIKPILPPLVIDPGAFVLPIEITPIDPDPLL